MYTIIVSDKDRKNKIENVRDISFTRSGLARILVDDGTLLWSACYDIIEVLFNRNIGSTD